MPYSKKLEANGIYTMGDIARCSIGKPTDFLNEELLTGSLESMPSCSLTMPGLGAMHHGNGNLKKPTDTDDFVTEYTNNDLELATRKDYNYCK